MEESYTEAFHRLAKAAADGERVYVTKNRQPNRPWWATPSKAVTAENAREEFDRTMQSLFGEKR